jgi:hypothetical protein
VRFSSKAVCGFLSNSTVDKRLWTAYVEESVQWTSREAAVAYLLHTNLGGRIVDSIAELSATDLTCFVERVP